MEGRKGGATVEDTEENKEGGREVIFFFSSRRRHTRYWRDWSSDVCSSDLKERKIFALTPPDLGTFMHNVIDEFSEAVDKSGLKWYEIEDKWCKDTVSEIVDRKAEESAGGIFTSSARYKYFTERLKRVLIKTILVIIEHLERSGFQPIGHEVGFGNEIGRAHV